MEVPRKTYIQQPEKMSCVCRWRKRSILLQHLVPGVPFNSQDEVGEDES
jgi:hypothetical protein